MATYGLRSNEISSLTLNDINWRTGIISVLQTKTHRRLTLPLTDFAAAVLIDYLEIKPKLPYSEVFLRIRAPHGPMKRTAVTDVFQFRVKKSGLDIPFRGPHCIRHSCATHLLRQGVSVKAIGDLLGHRNIASTHVYLSLALEDLRDVALPVPQETSCVIPKIKYIPRIQKRKVALPYKSILRSFLAEEIESYLQLKSSLGLNFKNGASTLRSLDAFLAAGYPLSDELTGEMFSQWCAILHNLSSTVRRRRMQTVRNFCLYLSRSRSQSFIPDLLSFPASHQPSPPHIINESEMARVLEAARQVHPCKSCLLRSETLRIAFLLLFTTGMRRSELLRLRLGDIDFHDETLSIRESKFHKSRIIPLSQSVVTELRVYLELRQKKGLPMSVDSPIALSGYRPPDGRGYTGTGLLDNWIALCNSLNILTPRGRPPRIHDLRHSFAVNALLRWYRSGKDTRAKLPFLSTYMGHVSVVSTHFYLTFIEELRSEASKLFYRHFGGAINSNSGDEK